MTTDDGTFDPLPPPRKIRNRIHQVGVQTIDHDEFAQLTGTISTDQTGGFPVTSRWGNKYIMVLYDFDTNAILATTIKSRKADQLVKGYNELYDILKQAGIQPEIQRLDNKTLKDLINAIKEKGLKYQIASPGNHRILAVERQIRTLKTHMLAFLIGCHPSFPANCWDLMIPQCVLTINMVRPS